MDASAMEASDLCARADALSHQLARLAQSPSADADEVDALCDKLVALGRLFAPARLLATCSTPVAAVLLKPRGRLRLPCVRMGRPTFKRHLIAAVEAASASRVALLVAHAHTLVPPPSPAPADLRVLDPLSRDAWLVLSRQLCCTHPSIRTRAATICALLPALDTPRLLAAGHPLGVSTIWMRMADRSLEHGGYCWCYPTVSFFVLHELVAPSDEDDTRCILAAAIARGTNPAAELATIEAACFPPAAPSLRGSIRQPSGGFRHGRALKGFAAHARPAVVRMLLEAGWDAGGEVGVEWAWSILRHLGPIPPTWRPSPWDPAVGRTERLAALHEWAAHGGRMNDVLALGGLGGVVPAADLAAIAAAAAWGRRAPLVRLRRWLRLAEDAANGCE
jgi:hypothetical protein